MPISLKRLNDVNLNRPLNIIENNVLTTRYMKPHSSVSLFCLDSFLIVNPALSFEPTS
jgi:hypothetical protein